MASLPSLPQELLDNITSILSRRDCKNLRLVSTQFAASSIPGVLREVHVAPHPQSWEKLQKIAADAKLANHVSSFVFFPVLLPNFDSYSGWMKYIGKAILAGKDKNLGNRSTSETMYSLYGDYREAVKVQQQMITRWTWDLGAVLQAFPRLSNIRSATMRESWASALEPEHYRGTLCNYDRFWQYLKPRHRFDHLDDLEWEPFLALVNGEYNNIYRSSVLQANLLAANTLLPSIRLIQCINLEIWLSLGSLDDEDGLFIPESSAPGQPSDRALYSAISTQILRSLEDAWSPSLKLLNVHILCGTDHDLASSVLRSLSRFLRTTTLLAELKLSIDALADEAPFYSLRQPWNNLESLSSIHLPALRYLSLSSSSLMMSALSSVRTLLQAHADTLKSLRLESIWMFTSDDDSLADLLRKIPQTMSLEYILLENLFDGPYNEDAGERGNQHFASGDTQGRQKIYDYILRGSQWPGWSEEIWE